jgi:allophanate hydrolase
MGSDAPETVAAIVAAHRAATVTPAQTIARCYQRIRAHTDPAVFISLRDEKDALAEAETLVSKDAAALPLFGVPVAVKDNIDAQGLPTTAACPAFSYSPAQDSTAVAKLRAAGAIIIGKTNLDQFATGLVGVRSPYGIPVNPIRADLIPGGSSSGSAVAVSAGLVPLALGTDTAGSGPRARDAQQHRRIEAEPRADLQRRTRSGVPDAGLHFGVLAHRGRRDDRAGGDRRT